MAAVGFATLLLCAGCVRDDPEAALRKTVTDMQAALEQRDAAAMQQHLADDFIGNDGLDRDGARRMTAAYLLRHRDIGINAGPLQVDMADTHAVVRFTAMLRGGSGRLLPDAARVYEVETGWRLDDGDWKLASASWKPAL
ncbi:nuclear transport factor 2 family protein [Luteimonas viscosa]|uniref:Nuclear transport factor 2 family protein n=1 Tax=Luteimonas viscosa TaxID=1132694 RepID=A0A5D4XI03_9GAMM|nr:nuclear transport factor 2 family protein [Luteimonas viscosa]TYT23784.1 nuclear transport factor 2 family protein [Luteimonas viscosa]